MKAIITIFTVGALMLGMIFDIQVVYFSAQWLLFVVSLLLLVTSFIMLVHQRRSFSKLHLTLLAALQGITLLNVFILLFIYYAAIRSFPIS